MKNEIRTVIFFALMVVLAAILIVFFNNINNHITPKYDELGDSAKPAPLNFPIIEENTKPDNWVYKTDIDKVTDTKIIAASVSAKKLLFFKSPYDGGQEATLTVRKKRNKTDIYLNVTEGQFRTHYQDNTLNMRFDKQNAFKVTYVEPSDGSSNTIFLNQEQTILKQLKAASTLLIEVEFYDNGIYQIEFDVTGFNWK